MSNQKKPNILMIMGDDIGYSNISAYTHYSPEDMLKAIQEPAAK